MSRFALLALGAVLAFGAPPTFYGDALPILQKNCQTCHRPGESGPMPLLTYEQARPWAKGIKAAVMARRMPPWFADAPSAHFTNERRLSDQDIATLSAWADAGALEGDKKDAPPPTPFPDDWGIQPDLILQMPDAIPIPATGTLEYTYIVIPTGFARDTWVTAAEIRPGNRAIVRQITALIRPRGSPWMRAATPFIPYTPPPSLHDGQPDADDPHSTSDNVEFLSVYSPGAGVQRFDIDGAAKLIPARADIVLQLYYQTNGKAGESDQTRIALTFAKDPPAKRMMSATIAGWRWTIPPGEANFEATTHLTFAEPVELVSLQPHMHLRGKDMKVVLNYLDGTNETVLTVPHYDFNWQIVYQLEKPVKLPKGTRVEVVAHWDNSANNPENPNPRKSVRWGNLTTDEMFSLPVSVIIDRY